MTTIPDLIDELRNISDHYEADEPTGDIFAKAADALESEHARADFHMQGYHRRAVKNVRLQSAINRALNELGDPNGTGPWLSGNIPNNVRRILTEALEGTP